MSQLPLQCLRQRHGEQPSPHEDGTRPDSESDNRPSVFNEPPGPFGERPKQNEPQFRLSTFYSVAYSKSGEVLNINNGNNALQSEESLTQIASSILKKGKNADTEKFFERFYRKDESHNSEKAGFGIGLSMAKEIVERMKVKMKVSYSENTISFSVDI